MTKWECKDEESHFYEHQCKCFGKNLMKVSCLKMMVKSVKMGDKKVKTDPEVYSYCFLSVFTFFLYFQETYIGNQRYTL